MKSGIAVALVLGLLTSLQSFADGTTWESVKKGCEDGAAIFPLQDCLLNFKIGRFGSLDEIVAALASGEISSIDQRIRKLYSKDAATVTPLMLAAGSGRIDVMQKLISLGAHVNASNEIGETAIDFAAAGATGEGIALLLARGADATSITRKHEDALHYLFFGTSSILYADTDRHVSADEYRAIAQRLIDARVNPHQISDNYGNTPLDVLILGGTPSDVKLSLVKAFPAVWKKDLNKKTTSDITAWRLLLKTLSEQDLDESYIGLFAELARQGADLGMLDDNQQNFIHDVIFSMASGSNQARPHAVELLQKTLDAAPSGSKDAILNGGGGAEPMLKHLEDLRNMLNAGDYSQARSILIANGAH